MPRRLSAGKPRLPQEALRDREGEGLIEGGDEFREEGVFHGATKRPVPSPLKCRGALKGHVLATPRSGSLPEPSAARWATELVAVPGNAATHSRVGVKDTEADELDGWERLHALSRAVLQAHKSGDEERAGALEAEWLSLRASLLGQEEGDA